MAGNLFGIGKSGLFAAQTGLATAGHNISNANVPGYSRQTVVQASATAQDFGYGFVGSGTQISAIKRYSDEFLNTQVRSAQSSVSSLDSYYSQISQIDNLLADTTSGLSPALQDFFRSVQNVASTPASEPSRQSLLSSADSLAARFTGISSRMTEIRDGVNNAITTNITLINSYSSQIAELNDKIGSMNAQVGREPNDLLDARDQLVAELNKHIKATVVPGTNNSLTVSIGNGQPLVVGTKAFQLAATPSATDIDRIQVGYQVGGRVSVLADSALSGGELGGLLEFRTTSLDRAQNSLGRIALTMAIAFNEQHRLGQDLDGNMGGAFFVEPEAFVGRSRNNNIASTTDVSARVVDPTALTQSDYMLKYESGNYVVTRLSDNQDTVIDPFPQLEPQVIDGVAFSVSGSAAEGDSFIVKPTINGASGFAVALQDRDKIAAAAPFTTSMPTSNTGKAKISEGFVDAAYLESGNAISAPFTLTFDAAAGELTGFPGQEIEMTSADGTVTTYAAGTTAVPYEDGASYRFGGANISFLGAPAEGDVFNIGPNTSGVGDNRNMRALGALQTKNILDGGSATFQSSYAEMVSYVGNKTREVQVNGKAGAALLQQATASQQQVAGVNLDEEATNLLRYQQAYQASGKVMQIASTLFDTLLSLGR